MKCLLLTPMLILLCSCSSKQQMHTTPASEHNTDRTEALAYNSFVSDTVIMRHLVESVKLSLLDNEENLRDSTGAIDWEIVNQHIYDAHMSVDANGIHYAPDSLFKIYSIGGSGGGAYGNPYYNYFFFSKNNTPLEITAEDYELTNILDINLMPDRKYMIMHQGGGRAASVMSVSCTYVDLISIVNDTVKFHPDCHFEACSNAPGGSYVPDSMYYNPATTELWYTHSKNYAYCCGEDTDSLFVGALKYENGKFVPRYEKVTFLPPHIDEE